MIADEMDFPGRVYGIQLKLTQYPILARKIRERMRQELFSKGIITLTEFEAEVRQKAILSQYREGLHDPFGQEPEQVWNERLAVVRDQLTDFYFAYNMPTDRLEEIIQSVLASRAAPQDHELVLTFNPELASWDLLFSQGQEYEALTPEKRAAVQHHLREIVVVLIKGMLSDQLEFVGVAKELFTIRDLIDIRRRCIGRGKIGGKAAGMLLAQKILQKADPEDTLDLGQYVQIPDSYFIGADVFYDFQLINGFTRYMNQKYRTREEIEADYPHIRRAYIEGRFPGEIIYSLERILERVGNTPLIVRSSSLLEVHFGAALAGKYESVFCPNQGTAQENLSALLNAVARVYASTLSPDALLYRQRMGLVDYDERMAVLIQKVEGTRYHKYFFPAVAGVGYSRNPFRWNPKIRREDGFLRLVCGFGTRAVERVANDYPRIVALSHPQLRPYVGVRETRKYSQHFIDVVDIEANARVTLPVRDVIRDDYPALRYLASLDKGDYLAPIISRLDASDARDLVLTFEQLTGDRHFVALMQAILKKLERYLQWPVDIEFTVDIQPKYPHADYTVHLLQCRPLVSQKQVKNIEIPDSIPESQLILKASKLVPQGVVSKIRYIIYVDPKQYNEAPNYETKFEIARIIGRLNKRLEGENFILIGPGRWGSSDVDLGVKVTYADIFNTKVLVEVPLYREGSTAEPSYGTHFFQDLIETGIFPLPIAPGPGAMLNTTFINSAPNMLGELLPDAVAYASYVRVVDVPAFSKGRYLEIVMNDEQERAVGYLKAP
ncbi:MAG TPA: PEP/pyruvate-binding domain-containing protein [Anaerolineae bacterium]|nr:PEP/pyruvate-binding domain-containing protein [Anaerolineae bacterium]HQK12851.1 PEP/pyruvate-binding domain-containing protein [Anaerolineae bacterium]